MVKYVIKRFLRSLITLLLIITAVFILLRQMPVEGYFNNFDKMTPTQIRVGLTTLGLNQPVYKQLLSFLKSVLHGDFGISNRYRVKYPIIRLIASKMPLSMEIGIMALCLSLIVGIPLGILMARSARGKSRFKLWERIGTAAVVLIEAIPMAVYALFIQIYGTELVNRITPLPTLFDGSKPITWVLPIFTLSLGNMALCAIWIRRYMVDESTKDYVALARAKGVPSSVISRRHIFRNAFVPVAQLIPTMLAVTLMGSLYVESRYSIPGMGGLLVDVIRRQDNTVVQALVLIYAGISILGLLLGDVIMAMLDPRIRLTGKGATR